MNNQEDNDAWILWMGMDMVKALTIPLIYYLCPLVRDAIIPYTIKTRGRRETDGSGIDGSGEEYGGSSSSSSSSTTNHGSHSSGSQSEGGLYHLTEKEKAGYEKLKNVKAIYTEAECQSGK
jgi:hypothetical protein